MKFCLLLQLMIHARNLSATHGLVFLLFLLSPSKRCIALRLYAHSHITQFSAEKIFWLTKLWLCPCSSSVIFICGCHPWLRFFHPLMTSTDGTFIHGWDSSIHGWHSWMTLPSMDEVSPAMDDTFIHEWVLLIHVWNCHPSHFAPTDY